MTSLRELKKKWMQDPEFRKEYEALEPEFALARTLIEARINAGLTQEEVAERMGTTQSVVARLGRKLSSSTLNATAYAGRSIPATVAPSV